MLARAMLAFLVLPGTVAFAVPMLLVWLNLDTNDRAFRMIGLVPLAIGSVLLLWCVRDFYVAGKGTLAPWAPPERLVEIGAYRVSRNPMYVAVVLVLCGWLLGFQSWPLLIYVPTMAVAFHVRVVFGEEPWLARTHGQQ